LRNAIALEINDIKKLCLQLQINTAEVIHNISILLDDEAMLRYFYFIFFTLYFFYLLNIRYQPAKKKKKMCNEKGEPLSATYMQHILHLNGLLLYLLAATIKHRGRVNGLLFILDFLLYLVVNDTVSDDTLD
jgi:hypothetical protein